MIRTTRSTSTRGAGGRGRGRGRARRGRNNQRSSLTASEQALDDLDNDFQPLPEEEDEDDIPEDNANQQENRRDLASFRSQPSAPKRTKTNSMELPSMENYQELGALWGKSKAEEVLAAQPRTHNRLPPNGLFEAQALQSQYDRDKTMLALALRVSRPTLDNALFEGPLAQEPNSYTNYQTYSNTATKTNMPSKGASEGFDSRNVIVGNTWSAYTKDQQKVFSPRFFEPLIAKSIPSTSTTSSITDTEADDIGPVPPEDPLTPEEVAQYLPIFKQLVNLSTVARDYKDGHLFRRSGKQWSREQIMKSEIGKVILNHKYKLQFHLLLGCWNPNNRGLRALFEDEYTSCHQWAVTQRKEQGLLECFVHTATHAPLSVRSQLKSKKISATAQAQRDLRGELSDKLNSLIHAHLSGPPLGKGDSHPKVPNPHLAIAKKTFRGNVKLAVQLSPDCKIDATILGKGAKAGALKDVEIHKWLDDINCGRYKVVKANAPFSNSASDSLCDEDE
ncbi:hypothetical protein DFH28DRAFT_911250 [Melampsora americana]|nr:hypothetical protein DFH28DRAFT_911250 [Melampsora americana]